MTASLSQLCDNKPGEAIEKTYIYVCQLFDCSNHSIFQSVLVIIRNYRTLYLSKFNPTFGSLRQSVFYPSEKNPRTLEY